MDKLRYRLYSYSKDELVAAFADETEAKQFARLKNCRLDDSHTQVIRGDILINGGNAYIWVTEPGKDCISLGTTLLDRFGLLVNYNQEGETLKNFRIIVEPDPDYLKEEAVVVLDAKEIPHEAKKR